MSSVQLQYICPEEQYKLYRGTTLFKEDCKIWAVEILQGSSPYYVYPCLLNQTQKTGAEHSEALNGILNGVYK